MIPPLYSIHSVDSNDPGEDRNSVSISDGVFGWCVVDGHGGTNACEVVNELLLATLLGQIKSLASLENHEEILRIIDESFQQIDQLVLDERKRALEDAQAKCKSFLGPERKDLFAICRPGCCVCVVIIVNEYIFAANTGDCRAFMCSKKTDEIIRQISFVTKDFLFDEMSSSGSIGSYKFESDSFLSYNDEILVNAITKDHCCTSEIEKSIITATTKDPRPIVYRRVAGSLAITRAIGDGYLKTPELSFEPFSLYLPYISCRPTIKYRKLQSEDQYIVLASDGLFNFVTAKECLDIVCSMQKEERQVLKKRTLSKDADLSARRRKSLRSHTSAESACCDSDEKNDDCSHEAVFEKESTSFAEMLIDKCLVNAAAKRNISVSDLRNLPQGREKRDIVDDVTVITIDVSCYAKKL